MLRLGAERDEVTVVDDQVGCPTYTGHLAAALVEIAERRLTGVLHVAGGGSCSWCELARRRLRARGRRLHRPPRHAPPSSGAPPRAPPTPCCVSERDDAPRLPAWQDGLAAHLAATKEQRRMRLLVCGGAGFIGSTFARQRVREHGDEVTCSTS